MIPLLSLVVLVVLILGLERQPLCAPLFRWLPVPLWCYALPMIATSCGWLPSEHPAYRALTNVLLPFALALLLLGADLPSVLRIGWRAVGLTAIGSASMVFGIPLIAWLLRSHLSSDAWKGVGTLAATWTGGSMNLLAVKTVLNTPDEMFAALIIVDALIAYTWMALLVGLSSRQASLDRWLRAQPLAWAAPAPSDHRQAPSMWTNRIVGVGCGLLLGAVASWVAQWIPANSLVSSRTGWSVLLVTTLALAMSLHPAVRARGRDTSHVGYA